MKTCCNGFWIIKTKQCNLRKAKREDGLERIWRRKNNPNWVLTDTFFVIDDTGRVVGIADFRHDSSVLRGKFCGAGDCREGRVGGIKQEAVNNDGIIKTPSVLHRNRGGKFVHGYCLQNSYKIILDFGKAFIHKSKVFFFVIPKRTADAMILEGGVNIF